MESNKKLWEPSESWLRNHTSSDLVYSVVVRLDSKEAVDKVWQQCAARDLVDDVERTVIKESEQDIERLPHGTLSHDVGTAEAGSNGPSYGKVLWGGASLDRIGDKELEACSGGEDALDSLEDCINELLVEVIKDAGVATEIHVTSEFRHEV